MSAHRLGDEYLGDSICCNAPMERDIGQNDDGIVESRLRCTGEGCGREYGDVGWPWLPVEIRRRVARVVEMARRGEL